MKSNVCNEELMIDLTEKVAQLFHEKNMKWYEVVAVLQVLHAITARDSGMPLDELCKQFRQAAVTMYGEETNEFKQ